MKVLPVRLARLRASLALRTAAVTAASLGAIVGACLAFQVAALGRPGRGDLIVVHTVAELVRYDASRATITLDGKPLTAVCSQHSGQLGQTETVVVDARQRLVKIGNTLVQDGKPALDEFELAGCPRSLSDWLSSQLDRGARFELTPTRLDGARVYALRVPSAGLGLKLFISRAGGLPVELAISGGGMRGASEVSYGLAGSTHELRSEPAAV
jgi:hypothetical protein